LTTPRADRSQPGLEKTRVAPPRRDPRGRPLVSVATVLNAWGRILRGHSPLLSIEITRECPLHCPGCYAYGDNHLGGGVTLRQLSDLHGDPLVERVMQLVDHHKPLQLSIVGGEPLVRHRELSRLLPMLSAREIFTLVVTSGVITFPREWNDLPRIRIAVSIDGLPPEHDARRHPATYDRILQNIRDRRVDISWVITDQMMARDGYLEEYLEFWTTRPEVDRIWLSLYTPQVGERSPEMLSADSRRRLIERLPALKRDYPALICPSGSDDALATPPASPDKCTFARLSINYSADLKTRVEPCFFGGQPDCTQCGCAVSTGLHWLRQKPLALGLTLGHVLDASLAVGSLRKQAHLRAAVRPTVLRPGSST
jgi:MoaA/NifB/PqqE/SkfB family radical SAM enzyme